MMNLGKKGFVFLLWITSILLNAENRVVCTVALANAHYEFRKQQYIEAFNALSNFGYNHIYIVEALNKSGPTFLEEYSQNVFYATVNNPHLKNQGINEALTLVEGCAFFNFDSDDLIIKFTGRHKLISNYFLQIIANNPGYDAYVKVNEYGSVFTLGFAMKYRHIKELYASIDYDYINAHMIPIEYRVGDYIKRKKLMEDFKVYYVDKLDIVANLLGSTTAPGVAEQILYY